MKKPPASSTQRPPRRRSPTLSFLRRRVVIRRLPAYLRGEVSPAARRETAQLLDHDDAAYAAYRQLRDADRDLRNDLAPLGRPDRMQLDRSFAAIGAALSGTAPLYTRLLRPTDWRTQVTAVLLALLLLVPVSIGVNHVAALGIATQPQPRAFVETGVTATSGVLDNPNETLTPALVTAIFIARATPAAPTTQ